MNPLKRPKLAFLYHISSSLLIPIHPHLQLPSLLFLILFKHVFHLFIFTFLCYSIFFLSPNVSPCLSYILIPPPPAFPSPLPCSLLSQHVSPSPCWSGIYPWVAARPWILRGKQFLGDNVLISRGSSDSIYWLKSFSCYWPLCSSCC